MRAAVLALALLLAACGGPYRQALDSPEAPRPVPPMTAADLEAAAPYDSRLFD